MRFRNPSCGSSFNICAVLRSIPGALCEFSILISFFISCRVKALRFFGGCACVLLGPIPRLDPDRHYEETVLPIGVL